MQSTGDTYAATAGAGNTQVNPVGGTVWRNVRKFSIVNGGTTDGWFAVDGGTMWISLLAGSSVTLIYDKTSTFTLLMKRAGASDLTKVSAFALEVDE